MLSALALCFKPPLCSLVGFFSVICKTSCRGHLSHDDLGPQDTKGLKATDYSPDHFFTTFTPPISPFLRAVTSEATGTAWICTALASSTFPLALLFLLEKKGGRGAWLTEHRAQITASLGSQCWYD